MEPVKIYRQLVEDTFDLFGWDHGWIRTDYSGRGMHGATCFAIALDNMRQAAIFLVGLTSQEVDNAYYGDDSTGDFNLDESVSIELAQRLRYDNLGFSLVVYFPGVQLVD